MGLVVGFIIKTIIGILGAGYCIELIKKLVLFYYNGKSPKDYASIVASLFASLFIVVWLNYSYITAIWGGIWFSGRIVVCELVRCADTTSPITTDAESRKPPVAADQDSERKIPPSVASSIEPNSEFQPAPSDVASARLDASVAPKPLDAAEIDLLVAKAAGRELPREATVYIMMRRWDYEHRENDSIDRFFPIVGQKPSVDAAAALAEPFIAWASKHAPSLPHRTSVKGSFEATKGQRPTMGWDVFPCFTTSIATLMSQTSGSSFNPFHEIAGPCRIQDVRLPFSDPLQVYVDIDDFLPPPDIKALGGNEKITAVADLTLREILTFDHKPEAEDIGLSSGETPAVPRERSLEGHPYVVLRLHVNSVTYADAQSGSTVDFLGFARLRGQ